MSNLPFLWNQHRIYAQAFKISQIAFKSSYATFYSNVGAFYLRALDELFFSDADVSGLSDEL